MACEPLLQITDGTTTIDLLNINSGILLEDWIPSTPPIKNDGAFTDNPLIEGRKLSSRVYNYPIDVFTVKLHGASQDTVIMYAQEVRRLLQKASDFWTSGWSDDYVWLVARGSQETSTRYAIIVDWRMQNDDNPYSPPFFGGASVAMDGITIAVEHLIWQDIEPGTTQCVQISNQDDVQEGVAVIARPTQSSDDANVNYTATSVSLINQYMEIGASVIDDWLGFGVRFRSVAIPNGSVILSARVQFIANDDQAGADCNGIIFGELNASPATFSTYADFIGRTPTDAQVDWPIGYAWTEPQFVYTPSVKDVVQEIVDLGGWASGNDMVLFFINDPTDPSSTNAFRRAASYDDGTYKVAELQVTYLSAPTTYGVSTCDPEVYVVNRHQRAHVNHGFNWQSGGGGFESDFFGQPLPWSMPPVTYAVGDIVYFGISDDAEQYGPFCNLVFDLDGSGSGFTGDWQYYNGSWTDFPEVEDQTRDWSATGVCSVAWTQPDDWIEVTINSINGFWVRYVVTATSSPSQADQQNNDVYNATLPYVKIADTDIGGDLPALARLSFIDKQGDLGVDADNGFVVALRSDRRGAYFTPYINLGNNQNPTGVDIRRYGDQTAFLEYSAAPSGQILRYDPTAAEADLHTRAAMWLDATIIQQYKGYFRLYCRCRQIGGTAGDFNMRLAYWRAGSNAGTLILGRTVNVGGAVDTWQTIELGAFDATALPLLEGWNPDGYDYERVKSKNIFGIQLQNTAGSSIGDLYLSEAILMPADEWIGQLTIPSEYLSSVNWYIDIDSILYPKANIRALNRDDNDAVNVMMPTSAPGHAFLQANSDQKIFMLDTGPRTEALSILQVERAQRYFSMRGAR